MWLSVCVMSFFGWRHIFSQLLQTYFARKWVIPNSGRDCHAWIKRILASMRLIWATFWWASRIRAEIWQKQNRTHYTHDFFSFFFKCIFYLLPPFKVFTNRHTNDRKQMHPTHHTNYPMHQFNTRLKCKQAVVNPIKLSEQGVNNQWTFTVNVYYVQLENNYESESALEPRLRLMSQLKEAFRVNCVNWHACIHTCVPPSSGATWFLRL